MARLNTRGTLTRTRWDYFEHTNGWASVYGSVASGEIGAYFGNNSTGSTQIDLWSLTWFASVSLAWNVQVYPPPLIITPLTPTDSEVHSCQPDVGAPAGVVGMFSAFGGVVFTLQRVSNQITDGTIAPVASGPFLTLPPGWSIGVSSFAGANPCELSMSIWYQDVLDNVPPAP